MNNPSLDIQRYNSGLMTPKEAAAFERAVEKSPDLQSEFDKFGDTLLAMYRRISEGMPAPDAEIKDILLSKIAEPSKERAGIMIATGAGITLTPDVLSDNSIATNEKPNAFSKNVLPFFTALTIAVLSVWILSSVLSNEPSLPVQQMNLAGMPKGSEVQNNLAPANTSASSSFSTIHKANSVIFREKENRLISEKNTPAPSTQASTKNIPSVPPSAEDVSKSNTVIVNPTSEPASKDIGSPVSSGRDVSDDVHNDIAGYQQDEEFINNVSFSIEHFSSLKFYPGRQDMAPRPSINNWGAAIKYAISPVVAIGIEAGRETFPFYREKSNDMYDEFYSVTWGGASVTVSDPHFEILDCHPEARGVLGFSDAGPLGKISAGFIWQPLRTISFSPELEYTGVYIKNTGVFMEGHDVTQGGKLGFTISAIVRF